MRKHSVPVSLASVCLLLGALCPSLLGATRAEGTQIGSCAVGEKRIMFLGDSITHFGFCEYYLQLFENLRHPGSEVRYYNAGYSGGTLGTGIANLAHELKRTNPERVFVMFGMNDVRWTEYETNVVLSARRKAVADNASTRYADDYSRLIRSLNAAGVTNLVLLTPTPYDEYSTSVRSPRRRFVNEYGLKAASQTVRRLAAERGLGLVDLNRALTDACRRFPDKALCGQDRVHPCKAGYLLMAAECLRSLGKDDPVAEVTLDAAGTVVCAANATVTNVHASADRLTFEYRPQALPFPDCPEYREVIRINPEFGRCNREPLVVIGLAEGDWELRADGRQLGTYSAECLARGVNLAELDTPNRREAARALKAMVALRDFDVPRRDCACKRIQYESFGVSMDDKVALKRKLDEYLSTLKANKCPWYDWEKATADSFLEVVGKQAELAEKEARLYSALSAVRPIGYRIEIMKR